MINIETSGFHTCSDKLLFHWTLYCPSHLFLSIFILFAWKSLDLSYFILLKLLLRSRYFFNHPSLKFPYCHQFRVPHTQFQRPSYIEGLAALLFSQSPLILYSLIVRPRCRNKCYHKKPLSEPRLSLVLLAAHDSEWMAES